MEESKMEDAQDAQDENNDIELGDKIHIIGGRYDATRGRIYYLDESNIRILPDGIADRLVNLELEDGYMKEEYEIENLYVVSKRTNPAFVIQQDYRVGNIAEAFAGPEGEPVGRYAIVMVDANHDSIVIKDKNNDEKKIKKDLKWMHTFLLFLIFFILLYILIIKI